MSQANHKSNEGARIVKAGELSKDQLKGASGGVVCHKDPNLSIQKKANLGQASHDPRRTGRVK